MTTSHTKIIKGTQSIQTKKAVDLRACGKKYSLAKAAKRNISTAFGDFWAVKDLSLDIDQGRVFCNI